MDGHKEVKKNEILRRAGGERRKRLIYILTMPRTS